MTHAANSQRTHEVIDWIRREAGQRNLSITIHQDLAREEADHLYLPVHLDLTDAFDIAEKLQDIEDTWNEDEPERHPRLLLVPTKD